MKPGKILVLFGVSGVGKTTLIRQLLSCYDDYMYVSPYMTRPLRIDETDKIPVSRTVMKQMEKQGAFLKVNSIYGVKYGAPIQPYKDGIREGKYPVIDWPIAEAQVWNTYFPDQWYGVYLLPPSVEELRRRLALDGRDTSGKRYEAALSELEAVEQGAYDTSIASRFTTTSDRISELADEVHRVFRI